MHLIKQGRNNLISFVKKKRHEQKKNICRLQQSSEALANYLKFQGYSYIK